MLENGQGIERDFEKAFQWCSRSAQQGFMAAQRHLGRLYEEGKGMEESTDKAPEWCRKAAENGDQEARRLSRRA